MRAIDAALSGSALIAEQAIKYAHGDMEAAISMLHMALTRVRCLQIDARREDKHPTPGMPKKG